MWINFKIQYESDKLTPEKKVEDVGKKISNTIGLVKKTDYTKTVEP